MRLDGYRTLLALALAALAQAAVIQDTVHGSGATCFTTKGTSSVESVATNFETVSVTAIKTQTIEYQSTTTIVPEDETSTKTVVVISTAKTTASAYMSGIAATSTLTVTSTKSSLRQTITKTVTKTSTATVSSTKTTTISTTSGFRPVKSTINIPPMRNEYQERIRVRSKLRGSSRAQSKAKHPQKVDCKIFTTITSTKVETLISPTPITVTASRSTITRITTTSVTSTDTVFVVGQSKEKVPIQYNTVTMSTSPPPVTTTTTVTKTKTTTDVVPGPTIYAACLGPNLFSYPGDEYTFYDTNSHFQFEIEAHGPTNGYECCAACFSQFNCAGGYYQLGCGFGANEVCGAQTSDLIAAYYTGSDESEHNPAPIFNGYCGEFNQAVFDG